VDCPTWDGVLIATAAVIAAGLAAWTANRRMGKQLAHDREMQDREALRLMLDDAIAVIGRGMDLIAESRQKREYDKALKEIGKPRSPDEQVADHEKLFSEGIRNLVSMTNEAQRLRLRFGLEHPITKSYVDLHKALARLFQREIEGSNTAEDDASTEMGSQISTFIELCRPYIGVKDP
jgi:hypothetical protein